MTLLSQPHLSHNFRPIGLSKGVVMNDCNDVVLTNRSQALALCRRYFVASFVDVSVQVREGADAARAHVLRCGLGSLEDGEYEVLGAWPAPDSFQKLSQTVLEDLRFRGVEKVRFFVCDDPAEVRADARTAYPGTTVLPSIGHLLAQSLASVAPRDRRALADAIGAVAAAGNAEAARDALHALAIGGLGASYPAVVGRWHAALDELGGPLYALAPRLRRSLVMGDGIVQKLHQSLMRAVARHGSFADREAATAFLAEALERAQRRLDARGMNRAAGAGTSVARRGMRLGTQALAS
jgi:transposase-like protein